MSSRSVWSFLNHTSMSISLTRNYESQTSWANIVFVFFEFNLTWTRRGNLFIQMAFNDSLCITLLLLIRVSRGDLLLFLFIESSYLYVKICMNFNRVPVESAIAWFPCHFTQIYRSSLTDTVRWSIFIASHFGTHCANIAKLPISRLFDKSLCIWFDAKELHMGNISCGKG